MKIVTQKGQRQSVLLLGCATMLRSITCCPQCTVGYVVTGQGGKVQAEAQLLQSTEDKLGFQDCPK